MEGVSRSPLTHHSDFQSAQTVLIENNLKYGMSPELRDFDLKPIVSNTVAIQSPINISSLQPHHRSTLSQQGGYSQEISRSIEGQRALEFTPQRQQPEPFSNFNAYNQGSILIGNLEYNSQFNSNLPSSQSYESRYLNKSPLHDPVKERANTNNHISSYGGTPAGLFQNSNSIYSVPHEIANDSDYTGGMRSEFKSSVSKYINEPRSDSENYGYNFSYKSPIQKPREYEPLQFNDDLDRRVQEAIRFTEETIRRNDKIPSSKPI